MSKYIKLVIYVPASHTNIIRQVLAENGAGHIRNYDSCSFSVAGIGRFRPGKNSNPAIEWWEVNLA